MFEVGFSEILVIMAIALVVLGPEKLPKLAATVGRWMGRAKAMARQFREQLEEEANKLELTKELNKHMESAKRQLDIAKSLGLNEDLEPKPAPPSPQAVAASEALSDHAATHGHVETSVPATGEHAAAPIEIPVADAPADLAPTEAGHTGDLFATNGASHAPHVEHVSEERGHTPTPPAPVEASVDSLHERRH